jgi:ketosteroid isomerase-like protein
MGQAREVMDRATGAFFTGDFDAAARCYAPDAVAVTPDAGELHGPDQIIDWIRHTLGAFPDARYELASSHEAGDVAIDEGWLVGTNTGPLLTPSGDELPATGRRLRLRSCDVARVSGDRITRHDFYFDQMDFLGQLGLLPEQQQV